MLSFAAVPLSLLMLVCGAIPARASIAAGHWPSPEALVAIGMGVLLVTGALWRRRSPGPQE